MGFFSLLKEFKEEKKRQKKYVLMDIDELTNLDDSELLDALIARIQFEESYLEVEECLETFTRAKRVFYIVNYFDREVQNGGLCQFFVNSSRKVAPYLLDALNEIEAQDYKNLLVYFTNQHHIDLHDLSSFVIKSIDEYEKQFARYPFDEFDNAYYELYESTQLDRILLNYVKKHLIDFEIGE